MKTLNLKPLTYEMLVEISGKKSKGDIERYLEQMIKNAFSLKTRSSKDSMRRWDVDWMSTADLALR